MSEEEKEKLEETGEESIDESLLTERQKEEYGKKMPIVPFAIVFGIFLIAIIALVIVILNLSQ